MNVILLSKNYEKYKSGYYHQDLVDSFSKLTNAFVYGPGYPRYSIKDSIEDVFAKSPYKKHEIDLIVCSTSWDVDTSLDTVNPHPKITLLDVDNIPKVYFLNKEYKKLKLRFDYIVENRFDLVCTVHPSAPAWEQDLKVKLLHLPFGVSLDRFKDYGLEREYDFGFTGSLHKKHTDVRMLVKRKLFEPESVSQLSTHGLSAFLKPNPLKHDYQRYNIFWGEFGAKDFFLRSLLPSGTKYAKFLSQFKIFLSTPSAIGIFNTRFFELMAAKTLIFCPESDMYMDILRHNENCIMFKPDMNDFHRKFVTAIEKNNLRDNIIKKAAKDVEKHSYDERVKTLLHKVIEMS